MVTSKDLVPDSKLESPYKTPLSSLAVKGLTPPHPPPPFPSPTPICPNSVRRDKDIKVKESNDLIVLMIYKHKE